MSSIHNLFIKKVSIHQVYSAVSMAHPCEMLVSYRAIRAYPWHDNFISSSKPSNRMGHTFSDADDQIGECNMTVHFHQCPSMSFFNNAIIGSMGIMGKN